MNTTHESLIQKKRICDCGYVHGPEEWKEKYPFQCQRCYSREWDRPTKVYPSWLYNDV